MGRVGAEIHENLVDLRGVGQDHAVRGRDIEVQVDRDGQGGAEELHGLLRQRDDVEGSAFLFDLPAEREDPAHEDLRAVAGAEDLREVPAALVVGRVLRAQLGVADHGEEDVVEVVGDAARQGAHGFHLLGLPKLPLQQRLLCFGMFPIGDVPGDADDGKRRAVLVPDDPRRHLVPARGTVLPVYLQLGRDGAGLAVSGRAGSPCLLAEQSFHRFEGGRREKVLKRHGHPFRRGPPEDPLRRGADVREGEVHVRRLDDVRDVFRQQAVLRLAFPQLLLVLDLLLDVVDGREDDLPVTQPDPVRGPERRGNLSGPGPEVGKPVP